MKKIKILLIFTFLLSLLSCNLTYYGNKTYKKLKEQVLTNNSKLNIRGIYYYEDSTYHVYNFKRTNPKSEALYPQDSIEIAYHYYIILNKDNTGHVSQFRWDGLNHSLYDSKIAPSGNNSKDSIHRQFLEYVKRDGLLDKHIKTNKPAIYEIKKDSIFIYFFMLEPGPRRNLYEIKGPLINDSSFVITNQKRLKGKWLSKKSKLYKNPKVYKLQSRK